MNKEQPFLNEEGGKTLSNAREIPSLSLPKGGGAIRGIDEKFSVNAVNGTASFSIPVPVSPARGCTPALSLSYNSGGGNGIFGLGWSLNTGSVKRKTEKLLPQYHDSDTFLLSEAEDLVAKFRKNPDGTFVRDAQGDYVIHERDSPDGTAVIRRYRPRVEGLFARIERFTLKASGEIRWRVISKENVTTCYGWSANARIADPADPRKIFEWLPEFVFDDKGNCTHYIYRQEDAVGFDPAEACHRNRWKNGAITYTNRYLEKVLYGNKTPFRAFGDAFPLESDYLFQTVLDYGTLQAGDPVDTVRDWDFRPDAFSVYRPGFEIRTTRLCKRILLFHVFDELANRPDGSDKKTLVKSLDFEYNPVDEEGFCFLTAVSRQGYIRKADGSWSSGTMPAMQFDYSKHHWNREVRSIAPEDAVHAPEGIHGGRYHFTDLFNEGLNGILTEQANAWYYKRNLGGGKFERAKVISPKPAFGGLGAGMQLADLDADGGKQLVSFQGPMTGYFELGERWEGLRPFAALPNISFGDANVRMLDLNGDGRPDVVISEDQVFTWYASEGRKGFAGARKTMKPWDEEEGAHIVFADAKQSIFLADMSGDGLTDIVRIRNGEVCYWPNLGYGRFGRKVTPAHSPVFDHPDAFNPAFIRLADIDGSGTTDLIYLGKNRFSCWKNLNGNGFSTTPFETDAFPGIHSEAEITVTDLLGNGVACIVWSARSGNEPFRYIDLMDSRKPHVLTAYRNGLGKEVSLEYTPSTRFYLQDRQSGNPWATRLHFPVHCISKTVTEDKISGGRLVSEYTYHHGYYDAAEREFRGFGRVEQTDTETFEHWVRQGSSNITEEPLHQEPVVSRKWFHTGAPFGSDRFEKDFWYHEYEKEFGAVTHPEVPLPEAYITGPGGVSPAELSPEEWREALRACKSMALRSETLAKDALKHGNTEEARKKALTPFVVSMHNCVIELLQPKGKNRHAVFLVKEREAITYYYERRPEDPRIAHQLNILMDEYGHVLESASVVYPRKTADSALPVEIRQEQAQTLITYTENRFTNDVTEEDAYRLRQASETRTFELKGVPQSSPYYSVADFTDVLADTVSDTALYHEFNRAPAPGRPQKRVIEHLRSVYYRNNLLEALPLHRMESRGLAYEQYQLAFSPELVSHIFGTKAGDAVLTEGKLVHSEGDSNWWVRSGTVQFREGAESMTEVQNRFFVPVSYTDPCGALTRVQKDTRYHLYDEETEDALGNITRVMAFNYRTLSPRRMRDLNGNLSEVISDELGLVKAMAVMGKGNEGDELTGLAEITDPAENTLIGNFFGAAHSAQLISAAKSLLNRATTRFVYDLDTQPAVVAAISREEHASRMSDSPVQITFEYSDGAGEVVMKKVQAEPGVARAAVYHPDGTVTVNETDTRSLVPAQLRWIGNGRTVKNNKGNAVKQYEPYFSLSWQYEKAKELVETGVTPLLYYDATGRLMKTEMPDGSFSKVEFDSWQQRVYDGNDTVTDSEWFRRRTDPAHPRFINNPAEQQAATQAARHAGTPEVRHLDTLGRPVLQVSHNKDHSNGADEFYLTRAQLDLEGNLRTVTDARGNTVMTFQYDMLGNLVYRNSSDTGQRWMLTNVSGNPLRTWDEREHELQYFYDIAQRPTHSRIIGGDGDTALNHIYDRQFYGESLLTAGRGNEAALQARNVLGRVIRHFDTGGVVETPDYDFKGQPLAITRRLFRKYREVADWTDAHLSSDLEADTFTFATETDALGRITRQTGPDGSISRPVYNATGLLSGEAVQHAGAALEVQYIKEIHYNEKGQREEIIYGNDVHTTFSYDRETFRLRRLESRRQNGDPLQDWHYTYDPAGNITQVEDRNIPVVFFNNQKITGVAAYTYDALYRLVEATGRENDAALSFGTCDNWNDRAFERLLTSGDPMAIRNYTQHYRYDAVGNIREMKHLAAGGSWTRTYEYEDTNNRLKATRIGDNGNPANYTRYRHHARHGFLEELPHLEKIAWNFKEQVVQSTRQHCTEDNIPVMTYYQYDAGGQRLRKITENGAAGGATPTVKEERIYVSGYEVYKKHSGTHAGLIRTSLGLLDGGHRFVLAETRNSVDDGTERHLVRYQLGNHQGSAALELDETARVISYEEYHPFGTTAYQARNAGIRSAARRYRYTGMERDEETGLEYHSARYYLPWLGRWLSGDPAGLQGGMNLYAYCGNNSIKATDTSGLDPDDQVDIGPLRLSNISLSDASRFNLGGSMTLRNPFSSNRSLVINDFSANGLLGFNSDLSLPALGLSGSGNLELNLDQLHLEGQDFSARLFADADSTIGPFSLEMDLSATGRMTVPPEIFFSNWSQQFDEALSTFSGEATLTTRIGLGPLVGFGRLDATARDGLQGDLDASGYARIGGYRLLEFTGAGSFSQDTYNMEGDFHGNFPLLLWGNWSMNDSEGFRASGHYFGPQLGPIGLNVGLDPLSGTGEGRTPPGDINLFEPGVSLGYTYFSYGENGSFIFSAGFSPVSTVETYNPAQPQIPVARSLPLVGDFLHQQVYGRPLSAPAGPYGGVRLGVTF